MLFLFFTSSAFYRYLSLARQVPGAPARTVTDRQTDTHTDTHDDYYNLAPSRARLITLSEVTASGRDFENSQNVLMVKRVLRFMLSRQH